MIDVFNIHYKEINDGDEQEKCISMCENPDGLEHCTNIMIIDISISGRTVHWVVCDCEVSTVPLWT